MSAEEAAEALGVSRSTVYRLLSDREFGSIRIGGPRRIRPLRWSPSSPA